MASRIEQLADGVTLYCGDCREILPTLSKVDAVVTSPPYGQQRDYGAKIDDWRALVSGALCGVPIVPDGQVLVNLGLIHRDGEVVPYWQPFIDDMRASGWRHFGWYVWDQLSGMAGDWNGRLAPSFEFILHFNREARKANKTKRTLGFKSGTSFRQSDGSLKAFSQQRVDAQETKIPDSVIRLTRENGRDFDAEHPARFPVAFAKELVAPFSDIGHSILDPFMGSGTTGVAAVKLGRKFIGIEIHEPFFDISIRRIQAALDAPDLFIEKPKPAQQESFTLTPKEK